MNKYTISNEDEFASNESNPISSAGKYRLDNELYKQEDDIYYQAVSVKKINLPRGGEDWEIYINKSRALVLKGTRFTKHERDFLRTFDGINFILMGYKSGWKSVAQFKREIVKYKKG